MSAEQAARADCALNAFRVLPKGYRRAISRFRPSLQNPDWLQTIPGIQLQRGSLPVVL